MSGSVTPPTAQTASSGKLVVLVGPAGAGKTTLAHRAIDARPDRRGFSVSHTTRPMRERERDGADYWFVTRQQFELLRDSGGFAEWAEVHGNLYGTSRAEIARLTAQGRDILFDIDIVGAHNLWRQYPDQTRLVFVLPPSWAVLVQRLVHRGTETEATLRRRLRTAREELAAVLSSPAPWWVILNDDLGQATRELEAVLLDVPERATHVSDHPALRAFLRDAVADPRADAIG